MHITAAQASWFRLRRSGLVDPFPSSAHAASKLVGVQGQIHTAAGLALWNRVPRLDLAAYEMALFGRRSIVKLWGQRNTLHVYRTTDWSLFVAAMQGRQTWLERAFERSGDNTATYQELLDRIEKRLEQGGTISRAEMRDMDIIPNNEWLTWGGVVMRLVRNGVVCHAEGEGSTTRFAHRHHWVPRLAWSLPPAEKAQRELVRRYLAAYGPATVQDLGFWLGVTAPESRAWLALADRDVEEVIVDGKAMLVRRKDIAPLRVDPPARSKWPVRLLYRFDPLLLGLKRKDWIVPAEHYKRVWRAGGHIEGTILVRDRVRGTWRYDRGGGGITVTLSPFERIPESVVRTLRSRAAGVARFFGIPLAKLEVHT